MSLKDTVLSEKKPDVEDYILYDTIYMKCPEEKKCLQKKDWWFAGLSVGGGVLGLIPGRHKEIWDDDNILTWTVVVIVQL